MEEESIEQITKTPPASKTKKIKDPKKVAAVKKLAEYNKKAKEALQRHEKREKLEKNDENEEEEENGGYSILPETSFTTIIAFLGLGVTAIDLFLRYKQQYKQQNKNTKPETNFISQKTETNFNSNIPETKITFPEEKQSGQFGME